MSRLSIAKSALPGIQSSTNSSQEDEMIVKLEDIFSSNSYNCFYKSRIPVSAAAAALDNQRQSRSDEPIKDLQEIYLKDCPKAKLSLCISFEKYRCLTLKYFKVFAPTRQNIYSYDIFLEIKEQNSQLIRELEGLKECLQQLIEFQKNCSFMPLRKIYLQVTSQITPISVEQLRYQTITQIINDYTSCRQQIQEQLFPLFSQITPLNFKQQFCFELVIDEQKSTQINRTNIATSAIVEFIQTLDLQLKYLFSYDKITIIPQQFFELSFYQKNETLIKESLNYCTYQIIQIQSFNKNCGQYQQYCPIRIYYDLYSE